MRGRRGQRLWAGLLWAGLASMAGPRAAEACGGCFAPPNAVQVVTDHRMVLSLSATRTVLWDQFRYSGRPVDFSWILPIRSGPDVRIEVGDNRFLQALDNLTAPVLNPPPRPRPPVCDDDLDANEARGGFADAGVAPAPGGVQVLGESVVGPYMTATLRGEDPMALRQWLRDNGYSVPAAIEPVLDHYVALRMDFVALKLRPGEGVDRMSPVRITTPGYNPSLPLRMIAAGTADKVGLMLLVLAQGRIEAMNFPNGEIDDARLVWDFNNPTAPAQDFQRAFAALNAESGGRLWLTESAGAQDRWQVERAVQSVRCAPGVGGCGVGGPDVTGDDARVAFDTLGDHVTVTRLRADLAAITLDRDLALAASDRPDRNRTYSYGVVRNRPPEFPPCGSDRVSNSAIVRCSVGATPGAPSPFGAVTAGVGLAGLVALGRRRRAR